MLRLRRAEPDWPVAGSTACARAMASRILDGTADTQYAGPLAFRRDLLLAAMQSPIGDDPTAAATELAASSVHRGYAPLFAGESPTEDPTKQIQALERAFASLAPEVRDAVLYARFVQLPTRRVAEIQSTTEQEATSRVRRAAVRIAMHLDEV